ncbi:uncharacterized protein N7529_002122 [Penicillium soppii]|uniref:uncharacterized protein n=1 Tax=Penicillium soppii TaxID=69789 RepID=UPI002548A395|nr:uncharacterized protein N7529_002122 [Penicillium soppii]KAJ5873692.1 hypothetical protein N7529_002122 [Penicillium soppii]
MSKHIKSATYQKAKRGPTAEITKFLKKVDYNTTIAPFSQEVWEEEILSFLSLNRLPFHLVKHPKFQSLIQMARNSQSTPLIPSADTIRRRLQTLVSSRQKRVLKLLPASSKISIALDY